MITKGFLTFPYFIYYFAFFLFFQAFLQYADLQCILFLFFKNVPPFSLASCNMSHVWDIIQALQCLMVETMGGGGEIQNSISNFLHLVNMTKLGFPPCNITTTHRQSICSHFLFAISSGCCTTAFQQPVLVQLV